jgi:hypothetical protein
VSLPGVTLPAGEYLFRLADSQTNRNIVQVYNKERSKLFATLIAIAAERAEPADDTIITFRETPANEAPALRYWFYPGDRRGQEFAYPMKQAVKIARTSGDSVMAIETSGSDMEAMQSGEMHRIDANSPEVRAAAEMPEAQGQVAAQPAPPVETPAEPRAETPAAAPTPSPADPQAPAPTPAEQAAPTPTEQPAAPTPTEQAAAPAAPQPVGTSGREAASAPAGTSGMADAPARDGELPRTASELPLVGLLGFLALGAAFGARALRRRLIV